jgi:hypothetical protein
MGTLVRIDKGAATRALALAATIALACHSASGTASESRDDEGYTSMPVAPLLPDIKPDLGFNAKNLGKNLDNGESEAMPPYGAITLLGRTVSPGTTARLTWEPQDTFESIAAPTPVLVMNGTKAGPTLCLTGAVHGDEINGIEMIRRVFFELEPEKMSGVLVGVPIVNQLGFRRSSRYLPDRRDLNRYFPGHPKGSSASRIAYAFFNDVVRNCDALVDIHTGSFHRTNIPQLRADMNDTRVIQLVHGFGGMVVLHSDGAEGTLRRAAVEAGIPSVTIEAGEPMRIQEDVVEDGVERIRALMTNLGLYRRPLLWSSDKPVYLNSRWVRSEQGGLLISDIAIGEKVRTGELLGKVVNPITNMEHPVKSPYDGQVIGMALNQVVMPGYAAYHIGIEATEETLEKPELETLGVENTEDRQASITVLSDMESDGE